MKPPETGRKGKKREGVIKDGIFRVMWLVHDFMHRR